MAYEPTRLVYLGRDSATVSLLRTVLHVDDGTNAHADFGGTMPTRGATPDDHAAADVERADGGGFAVEAVTSQKAVLRYLADHPTAVVLVETNSRSESRLRFCQTLRNKIPTAPIVAIGTSPRQHPFQFDAVLPTPLDREAVRWSLHTLRLNDRGPKRRAGPVELDVVARRVTSGRGEFELTPKQCALLELLMEHAGAVVRRADIMRMVWETTYLRDTRTLDVHVHWLRKIIEPDPDAPIYLVTVRGVGYKFVTGDT